MLPVASCLAVHTVIAAGMEALYSAHLAIFALPGTLGHWHLDMEPWIRLPLASTGPSPTDNPKPVPTMAFAYLVLTWFSGQYILECCS